MDSEELLKQLIEGQAQLFTEIKAVRNEMATKQELSEVKQSVIRMENTMINKFGSLFDAREVQFDVNERILASLERIEEKVGKHDIQISVLDRVKCNRRKMK
jgi:hypothetical protein